jgi:uncharacterized protein
VEGVTGLRGSFYVYALKDPRNNPARPFYIGKGTGIRAWEHELKIDSTPKGRRIREIQSSGSQVLISKLLAGLTELEALRLEAELISVFGTETTGGMLTNSVMPATDRKFSARRRLTIPSGAPEKAQLGVSLLKEAVLELALANEGVTNSDVVHALGLHSDYLGGSKDYLSWSVLGLLMRGGKMLRVEKKIHKAQVR